MPILGNLTSKLGKTLWIKVVKNWNSYPTPLESSQKVIVWLIYAQNTNWLFKVKIEHTVYLDFDPTMAYTWYILDVLSNFNHNRVINPIPSVYHPISWKKITKR